MKAVYKKLRETLSKKEIKVLNSLIKYFKEDASDKHRARTISRNLNKILLKPIVESALKKSTGSKEERVVFILGYLSSYFHIERKPVVDESVLENWSLEAEHKKIREVFMK